jgi:hypothetical protein
LGVATGAPAAYSGPMFDTLFTLGQTASALLLVYGGLLVLLPARRTPEAQQPAFVLRHLQNDA